jgi:hypothetical protein
VQGQVVENSTGRPVPGTVLALVVVAPDATRDSVTTTAGSRGDFQLGAPATEGSHAELLVQPPGYAPYRVAALDCAPTSLRGGGCPLGTIVANPRISVLAELHYRPDFVRLAGDLHGRFERTSGSGLVDDHGTPITSFPAISDDFGRFLMPPPGVYSVGLEPLVGDVTFELQGAFQGLTTVLHGVELTPSWRFRDPTPVATFLVGPSLTYYLLFFDSTTGGPVDGVEVSFTRTGGIDTSPATFSATSLNGRVTLALAPLAAGAVTGDLVLKAPQAAVADTVRGITLPVFDADDRMYAVFAVAPDGTITRLPPTEP